MQIVVPKQADPEETRVCLTPSAVAKLLEQGVQILIERGVGRGACHDDAAYAAAGATVVDDDTADAIWSASQIILTIGPPDLDNVARLGPGTVMVGMLDPFRRHDLVTALAERSVTAFSMELLPRISRAQSMDVLSSQANIAGYEAVILAAQVCPKIFPMMITAAGTITPARVMVIGAGVAGLQAIATAKRLGAVVEAYDIRPEVEEQIRSLAARFIKLPKKQSDASTDGGYAKQQSDEERKQQADLMAKHVIAADVVISTAAIFGRPPPMLISEEVVAKMTPGAVLVDLAADAASGRGNCALTSPGQRIRTENGVVIDGTTNLPGLAPVHSSHVLANNMVAFLEEILYEGSLKLNLNDELHKGPLLTHEGEVVNEMVKKTMEAAPA